jgi:hypothetical protein
MRPYLENNPPQKWGWQSGSSGKSACLTSVKPRVQTPMPSKNNQPSNSPTASICIESILKNLAKCEGLKAFKMTFKS